MKLNIKALSILALSLVLAAALLLSGCGEQQWNQSDGQDDKITAEDGKKNDDQDDEDDKSPDSKESSSAGDTESDEPDGKEPSESAGEVDLPSSSSFVQYFSDEFSIAYPQSWDLEEGYMGTMAIFLSPQTDDTDIFRENLNISVEDLSANPLDLDAYSEAAVELLGQVIQNMKVVSLEETTLDGYDAYRLVYTGEQSGYSLLWTQYWTIKDDKAYVITYTSHNNGYDIHEDTAQQMFESFTFR